MFFETMIPSIFIDFPWTKVAIKVIRSAFTANDMKRFHEVSGLIRCSPVFNGYRPLSETSSRSEALDHIASRQYRTVSRDHDHFRHVPLFGSCVSVALLQKRELEAVRHEQQPCTPRQDESCESSDSFHYEQSGSMLYHVAVPYFQWFGIPA